MTTSKFYATYPAIVGKTLYSYRKHRKLSQKDVAKELDITISTWSRIENGETAINIEQLAQVAVVLGIPPSEIIKSADLRVAEIKKKGIEISEKREVDNELYFPIVGSSLVSATAGSTSASLAALAGASGAMGGAVILSGMATIGAVSDITTFGIGVLIDTIFNRKEEDVHCEDDEGNIYTYTVKK